MGYDTPQLLLAGVAVKRRPSPEYLFWSAVHGEDWDSLHKYLWIYREHPELP